MVVLYSFRRCPYAIRARLALASSQIEYELREVVLKNKPQSMLTASAKATVPVLIDDSSGGEKRIVDESFDVMMWALKKKDPDNWLACRNSHSDEADALINENDTSFKHFLDRYKYFDRFPEQSQSYYLEQAMLFVTKLENQLNSTPFLFGKLPSYVDAAIFPFIRQFAFVDKPRFDQLDIPKVHAWLNHWLTSDIFNSVMTKHTAWEAGDAPLIINAKT